MDRRRIKFVTLILAVALSMTFLIVVAMNRSGTMLYYLSVTEFRQQTEPYDTDFRINGTVVTGSIERLPTGIDVRFTMTDGESEVRTPSWTMPRWSSKDASERTAPSSRTSCWPSALRNTKRPKATSAVPPSTDPHSTRFELNDA
jgi:hypothetical protein